MDKVYCKDCKHIGPDNLCKSPKPPHEIPMREKNKNNDCQEFEAIATPKIESKKPKKPKTVKKKK